MGKQILTLDGKLYELKYNDRTIEVIEAILQRPFMSVLSMDKGVLSLRDLGTYFAQALYMVEGGRVPAEQGSKIFKTLLHEKGYMALNMLVVTTIQEDCPFFFLDA